MTTTTNNSTTNNNTAVPVSNKGRVKVLIGGKPSEIQEVTGLIKLSTSIDTLNFKNRGVNCLVRDWIDIGDRLLRLTHVSHTCKFLDLLRLMVEDQHTNHHRLHHLRGGSGIIMFTYYETFSRDGTLSSRVDISLDSVLGKTLIPRPLSDIRVGLPWDAQVKHLRRVGCVTLERGVDLCWWFSQEG